MWLFIEIIGDFDGKMPRKVLTEPSTILMCASIKLHSRNV
jgi:hypothetical protein